MKLYFTEVVAVPSAKGRPGLLYVRYRVVFSPALGFVGTKRTSSILKRLLLELQSVTTDETNDTR